jgi:RNA polymerase sigma-70 factor (ECF subfamily)
MKVNFLNLFNKKLSDEQLMCQYQGGSQTAFNAIYLRYSQRLLRYFYGMLGQSEEKAQDFLQEIFLILIEKPRAFDSSRPFSTWLFSIANNMCKNEYRRMHVREGIQYIDDCIKSVSKESVYQSSRFDLKVFHSELKIQLEKLSEEERSCFILRYQEEFSIKEISSILDCPEGTIKSRLFYTIKKLSKELKEFNSLIYKDN